jgi:hypothetical protein
VVARTGAAARVGRSPWHLLAGGLKGTTWSRKRRRKWQRTVR